MFREAMEEFVLNSGYNSDDNSSTESDTTEDDADNNTEEDVPIESDSFRFT
jgi:hypothetical protein